ncbi:hypothetical protein GF376_01625 [Candidatus Peregrinibacteria bacterium]|nr:hypothetical protein [Candidatus Peregrinibacteria bacterium]
MARNIFFSMEKAPNTQSESEKPKIGKQVVKLEAELDTKKETYKQEMSKLAENIRENPTLISPELARKLVSKYSNSEHGADLVGAILDSSDKIPGLGKNFQESLYLDKDKMMFVAKFADISALEYKYKLAKHPERYVRSALVFNDSTPDDVLEIIADSGSDEAASAAERRLNQ